MDHYDTGGLKYNNLNVFIATFIYILENID